MKFGLRTPSLKKSISARISVKRYVRHNIGVKAPRGYGWFTNPKKALYNRVYNRTTFSVWKGFKFLSLFYSKLSNSKPQLIDNVRQEQSSLNIVRVIVNLLALIIVSTFFIDLYNQAINFYGSYFWTNYVKSDGKLSSGFTSIIMILILLGLGINLWWITLIFFGYVCFFFIEYYQLLLINIPLAYIILMIGLAKLGFSRNVSNEELDEPTDVNKFKVDEQKVDDLVNEYRNLNR